MDPFDTTLSDYQLIELFDVYLASAITYFMNFVAVLFAFVVATYAVGSRISKLMVLVITALYTIFTFGQMTGLYVSTLWWHEIATELAVRGVDATGRISYPTTLFGGTSGEIIRHSTYLVYILCYIGGLLFLREVRKASER